MAGFDLPINDVQVFVKELIDQIGEDCTVDGVTTKTMVSDLPRAYNNLQENTKMCVLLKGITVKRGSKISLLTDGRVGIVYSMPNDDIVSLSMKILMCNAKADIFRIEEVYDNNTGDITSSGENLKANIDCFIERLTAMEKQYDVGLLHESILRMVTYVGTDILLEDTVKYKGKRYRVVDIDDITEGLLVIQLASVRS